MKYFNIKGHLSVFCFYFMDKTLIAIEFYGSNGNAFHVKLKIRLAFFFQMWEGLRLQETSHTLPRGWIAPRLHVGSSSPFGVWGIFPARVTLLCPPEFLMALLNNRWLFFVFCRAFGQHACKLQMQRCNNVKPLI